MKRIITIATLLLASGCSILQNPVAKKEAEILKTDGDHPTRFNQSSRRTVVHLLTPTAQRANTRRAAESVQNRLPTKTLEAGQSIASATRTTHGSSHSGKRF